MKLKLSLPKPQIVVYYWAKLLGLAPFTLKNDIFYPATLMYKVYAVTFAAINLVCWSIHIYGLLSIQLPKTTPKSASDEALEKYLSVYIFIMYTTVWFTPLVIWSAGRKVVRLMNGLCITNEKLRSLGIIQNHKKDFKNLLLITFTINAFVGITWTVIRFWFTYGWLTSAVYFVVFRYLLILNAAWIFCQILQCIGKCFKLLNRRLRDDFELAHYEGLPQPLDGSMPFMVGALHLKLCDLLYQTTEIFAALILVCVSNNLVAIILESYSIFNTLKDPALYNNDSNSKFTERHVMLPLYNLIAALVEIFIVVRIAGTTYRQANATKVMLFEVWNKHQITKPKIEGALFSLQLVQTPAVISAFGIVDLDYSLFYKIFGVTVAYLITMIQFEKSSLEHITENIDNTMNYTTGEWDEVTQSISNTPF